MEQGKKKLVAVLGKRGDAEFSKIASALDSTFQTIYTSESLNVKPDILIIPICYPFPDKIKIEEYKQQGIPTLAIVIDALAIESLSEVVATCTSVLCFSRSVKNKLLAIGIPLEKINLNKYPILNKTSTRQIKNNNILIPSRRLKNDQVDCLLSCLYKAKLANKNIQFVFFGSDVESVNNGFSKHLVDSINSKGFSSSVRYVASDYTGDKGEEYKHGAICTLLFSCNEQNQVETLQYFADSISHGVPVLADGRPIQCDFDFGNTIFRTGDKDSVVKDLCAQIFSANLIDVLSKEIQIQAMNIAWQKDWLEHFETIMTQSKVCEQPIKLNDAIEVTSTSPAIITLTRSIPKILMQNRSNAFNQPGGDTVVMEKILALYAKDKVQIDVCVDGSKSPKGYDLVHLFNFAIREVTEQQAKQAVSNKVPYLVTTLYEDWPVFYNQMAMMYMALKAYVEHGQPVTEWIRYQSAGSQVERSAAWDNSYAANNADCLVATGEAEVSALTRDYSAAKRIISIPLGCEVTEFYDNGDLFKNKYGISDFVLCVGRIEWRKNQLMLLKALEEVDVPVVFAASSFTYQPEYDALCRAFKRRGKTIFLSRLTDQELASAYQAAKVHVLPSWYELPGLVNLEAARYGTPVVVSNNGTTADYLGNDAIYCDPADAFSIRNAVLEALELSKSDRLRDKASKFTWEKTVSEYVNCYNQILDSNINQDPSVLPTLKDSTIELTVEMVEAPIAIEPTSVLSNVVEEINTTKLSLEEFCDQGDTFFKSSNLAAAKDKYQEAIELFVKPGRAYRSLGALCLFLKEFSDADLYFTKALEVDQFDSRALLGKGAVLWEEGKKREAFNIYKQASELKADDPSVILYLVNSAYELNALPELEDCLRRFLRQNPTNMHIQYCLAGCYYKQDKLSAALGVIERLLAMNSRHADGLELKSLIEKKLTNPQVIEAVPKINTFSNKPPIQPPVAPVTMESSYLTGSAELKELEEMKATRQYQELIDKVDVLLLDARYCDTALDHFDLLKAEALGCIGKVAEAETILLELNSRNVLPARVLSDLGALALASRSTADAIKLFESALSADKSNDTALAGLAMCAQAEGRLEDAWTLFEETLKRNCQNIQAIYGLVQLGYEFDRLPKVEKFLREYLELKPIDISILYSLAGCLYAQGKSQEAVGELRNILLFDPNNESALELMEKIHVEGRAQQVM